MADTIKQPFDFERCDARILQAQQAMSTAPTVELTAYWCRIWRARRRTLRIAMKHQLRLTND